MAHPASLTPLTEIKQMPPISGWQDFLSEGLSFFNTAEAALKKNKKAFTPEILYNIIAMAIEKFVMAALMRHGAMPYNHTMKDLVEAMDETFPKALDDLRAGLLRMDEYQDICDLDGFSIIAPEMNEIPEMLTMARKLNLLVTGELSAAPVSVP